MIDRSGSLQVDVHIGDLEPVAVRTGHPKPLTRRSGIILRKIEICQLDGAAGLRAGAGAEVGGAVVADEDPHEIPVRF